MIQPNELILHIVKEPDSIDDHLYTVYGNDMRREWPLANRVSLDDALEVVRQELVAMPGTDSCGP